MLSRIYTKIKSSQTKSVLQYSAVLWHSVCGMHILRNEIVLKIFIDKSQNLKKMKDLSYLLIPEK